MIRSVTCPLTIVATALLCSAGTQPAAAQDATAWDKDAHAAARLIAGASNKSGDATWLRAAIEIRLDPGWKTYWREPGDSGVPPTFDFSGSENVKSVTVLWPPPERFPDGAGGNSIGYVGDIVLPLRVLPQDATKPPSVHLKLDYAVCGTLCVPAEANLALSLSGNGTEDQAIVAVERQVPRKVALGAGGALAIRAVHREPGDAHERVVVEVAAPEGAAVDLFVEGPTPEWSLPLPEPDGGSGPVRRFSFELDGLPEGAKPEGAVLTFTAVSGDDAIEVPVHLD
jgi:DsbC/DsbD-like thiol-disulfide interchange protein